MLRKTLFLVVVLAMMISIAVGSLAQKRSEVREPTGSPLRGVPSAERLKVEQGPIDVLFVVSDSDGFPTWEAIYNEFRVLPEVGVCNRFDSFLGTPTVAELQGYDVVITWANLPHADPDALGDNLADYIDAGGKVINNGRVTPWHVGGRFLTDGYDPLISLEALLGPANLGGSNPHDIMNTPYAITTLWGDIREQTDLRPGAELVAWWDDGENLVATNGAVRDVVGMTAFLHGESRGIWWDGQFPQLLANACVWLVGGGPPTYTLTVHIDPPEGGNVDLDPPGGIYEDGTVVTLTAIPNDNWQFVEWSGDITGSGNPAQITMDSDKEVTAHFKKHCPFEKVTSDDKALSSLRKLRDDVLSDSKIGQSLIETYYLYSSEVVDILVQNPMLSVRGAAVLKDVMPGIRHLVGEKDGRDMVMTRSLTNRIQNLLTNIGKKGSKDLAGTLSDLNDMLEACKGARISKILEAMKD